MTNRNFRKNLALLCTLAGNAVALTAPISAMEVKAPINMSLENCEAILGVLAQKNYDYKQCSSIQRKSMNEKLLCMVLWITQN